MYGFVTDSPLFDNPGGFYRPLTNEEDIRLRASAQQAMHAGRPMTMAEMYGKPQQLFRQLNGFGEGNTMTPQEIAALSVDDKYKIEAIVTGRRALKDGAISLLIGIVAGTAAGHFSSKTELPSLAKIGITSATSGLITWFSYSFLFEHQLPYPILGIDSATAEAILAGNAAAAAAAEANA